jgi:hypothetical protein
MSKLTTLKALALTLPYLFFADLAFGNCNAQVNLHLSSSKIHISNGLKCIEVTDPTAPIDAKMTIKLPSAGNYPLKDGQVVVSTTVTNPEEEFPVKSSDDPDLACDPGIKFSGTNEGNNDMEVAITGAVSTTGVGCYDVVVGGLGRLDPRAKIVERNSALGPGPELADIFESIDQLKNTDYYGPIFDITNLEDFFQSEYGISEEEARQIAVKYGDGNSNTGD